MRLRTLTVALFFLALAFYLPFLSQGLDDFDSFSFVLAMRQYDLVLQQPHPPGFPFYMGMANALNLLIGDAQRTLVLLSAFWGAIGVVALLHLGTRLFNQRVGLGAALLLMLLPSWWIHSSLALSDVVGLALPLWAMALVVRPRFSFSNGQIWIFGWFLAGLSLGLRPHNAVMIVILGLFALWQVRHAWRRAIGFALISGVMGCLVWFVPLMVATGGLSAYLEAIRRHSQHVIGSDSLFSTNASDALSLRLAMFGQGLQDVFGGVLGFASIALGLGFAIQFLQPVVSAKPTSLQPLSTWRGATTVVLVCLIWLLAVTGKLFLIESLERPRLYLPMLPPLLLLLVAMWDRQRWVLASGVTVLCAVFLATSVPLVATLHTERSAPEQAAAWIRETYPPEQTIVVSLGSYRAAQVLLSDTLLEYSPSFGAGGWRKAWEQGTVRYLVLMDRDDLPTALVDEVESMGLVVLADRTFERDRTVFPQHVTVRVQVLVAADALSAADLALPIGDTIKLADSEAARYLSEGWYRAEDIGGVAARWASNMATLRVALSDEARELVLSVTPYPQGQSVQVWVNGNNAGMYTLNGVWSEVRVPLQSAWLTAEIDVIELRHTLAESPSGDSRVLAAAYREMSSQ